MNIPVLDKVSGYNLYIGGFISLRRDQALTNCRITHILSVLDWHFDDNSPLIRGYKHLHIPVDDVDDANLLTWFSRGNRFIDEGLNYWHQKDHVSANSQRDLLEDQQGGSGVLVHCAMGKSRSATMILAYLLWDSRRRALSTPPPNPNSDTAPIPPEVLDVPAALALLRQSRPIAEPNDGFMEQLTLYHVMGCPEEVESQPRYQRWLYQRTVQESLSVNRAPEVSDVRFEDEHLVDGEGDLQITNLRDGTKKDRDLEIKCRKCRRLLGRGNFTADHEPPGGKKEKDCAHLFLHPLSWMKDVLSAGQLDGRLSCPNSKCNANIGKFAWQGMRCSCGGWVTPGFGLTRAKIDETTVITRKGASLATTESAAPPGGGVVSMPPGMRRVEGGNL